MPDELATVLFHFPRRRRTASAGAGLGLSIAKGIVKAHHGSIELARLAHGTRFTIRLPVAHLELAPHDAGPAPVEREPRHEPSRV